MVAAAEFMREQAKPGERFVGTKYDGILAYLSDVPCHQFDLALAYDTEKAASAFSTLPEQDVRFVVIEKNTNRVLLKQLQEHVDSNPQYELALDNPEYKVYAAKNLH